MANINVLSSLMFVLCAIPATLSHTSRLPGPFIAGHGSSHVTSKAVSDAQCALDFTLGGAKFNVSELQIGVGGYIAINAVAGDNHSYCINVCKDVTSERNCICYACGGSEYPATQILKEGTKGETCTSYLGSLQASAWSLIDTATPAKGLVLSYGKGQTFERTEITMLCDPSTDGLDAGPTFLGSKLGLFSFTWNTSHACPL